MNFAHLQADVASIPLADESCHALLSDPPYGLSFMGRKWDKDVPAVDLWREVYRVLKPGAFGLVFGGTRTFHRLAVALEDAGFELRDTLCWLYGSGFPKSLDVSKAIDKAAGAEREVVGYRKNINRTKSRGEAAAFHSSEGGMFREDRDVFADTAPATPEAARWDGYGTALKPAWEPILLIRRPPAGTIAGNALEHGCGALNIDGGRIAAEPWTRSGLRDDIRGGAWGAGNKRRIDLGPCESHPFGRWPANVILDEAAGEMLDKQSGEAPDRRERTGEKGGCRGALEHFAGSTPEHIGYWPGGGGGASRFFYCAKAHSAERNAGLEDVYWQREPLTMIDRTEWKALEPGKRARGCIHPTLKPIDLCRYLATLLLPPGNATLLVPFAGSGSEMIGAHLAGWRRIIGLERNAEYIEIQRRRCEWWGRSGPAEASAALEALTEEQVERDAGQEMLL